MTLSYDVFSDEIKIGLEGVSPSLEEDAGVALQMLQAKRLFRSQPDESTPEQRAMAAEFMYHHLSEQQKRRFD